MAEKIEERDIEDSAGLVKTGLDLLNSYEGLRGHELNVRKSAHEEVEFRQRWGDSDGMLDFWKEFLCDVETDIFDTEQEIREVQGEVAAAQKEYEALLSVHNEFKQLETETFKGRNYE